MLPQKTLQEAIQQQADRITKAEKYFKKSKTIINSCKPISCKERHKLRWKLHKKLNKMQITAESAISRASKILETYTHVKAALGVDKLACRGRMNAEPAVLLQRDDKEVEVCDIEVYKKWWSPGDAGRADAGSRIVGLNAGGTQAVVRVQGTHPDRMVAFGTVKEIVDEVGGAHKIIATDLVPVPKKGTHRDKCMQKIENMVAKEGEGPYVGPTIQQLWPFKTGKQLLALCEEFNKEH